METTLDVQKTLAQPQTKIQTLAPIVVLIALAPIIAEVLLGNLIFGPIFIQLLVIDTLLYGSAALLIREVARRFDLGWVGIVLLALAAGIVEEGLVLQTLFNPNNPALEWMKQYGFAYGVNWFWAFYVLGLHTIWSITIPVLLAEMLFPRLQDRLWLGRIGLWITAVIYLASTVILGIAFRSFTQFYAPLPLLIAAFLAAVLLIGLALRFAPQMRSAPREKKAPARWLIGVTAFFMAALFSAFFVMLPNIPGFPLGIALALYGLLYTGIVLRIWRWSTRGGWGDPQRLALASGALIETMLFGFLLVARGIPADIVLHIALSVIFVGLLIRVGQRMRRHEAVLA